MVIAFLLPLLFLGIDINSMSTGALLRSPFELGSLISTSGLR